MRPPTHSTSTSGGNARATSANDSSTWQRVRTNGVCRNTLTRTGRRFSTTTTTSAISAFGATASDNLDPTPALVCGPDPVAIGNHTVTCTSTDDAGNESVDLFAVHVRGAGEQTGRACALITSPPVAPGIRSKLVKACLGLEDQLDDPTEQHKQVCRQLAKLTADVGKKPMPPSLRQDLLARLDRIKTVAAC